MRSIRNGVSASQLGEVAWLKSSASTAQGNCVEMAPLDGGEVAVRNSRDPHGPALVFTRPEIAALAVGVKAGEFDFLTV
ncbi:DUF397 domain-containing protein [Streptacidiphilus sp. 4-A2]|nr:DUF397 domain-containing protein [Streptacidiphilus sp. 4-A2]